MTHRARRRSLMLTSAICLVAFVAPADARRHHRPPAAATGSSSSPAASPASAGRPAGAVIPSAFAQPGDADDGPAIGRAAAAAVARGVPLYIDRDYRFSGTLQLPPNLVLRSDFSDTKRLISTGTGDGIVISGPIDMDGVVIDGALPQDAQRSTNIVSGHCLIGIHGDMKGNPSYLSGVRIGRLRIQNTDRIGIVLANLADVQVGRLELHRIYHAASIWTGMKGGHVGQLIADDIGNLRTSGHRGGQAFLMTAEPAVQTDWYAIPGALPVSGFQLDNARITRTTDTAFYVNDDRAKGIDGLVIGTVTIDTAGKDGFKIRSAFRPVTNTRIGSVQVKRVAGVGFSLQHVRRVAAQTVSVDQAGYDAVGDILGHPAPFNGDTLARSISNVPEGVAIVNSDIVSIANLNVSHVTGSPANGAEGNGISLAGNKQVSINGNIDDTAGAGLRDSSNADMDMALTLRDVSRRAAGGAFALVTNDSRPWNATASYAAGDVVTLNGGAFRAIDQNSGQSPPDAAHWAPVNGDGSGNRYRLRMIESSGRPFAGNALRVNGAPDGMDVVVQADPKVFTRSGGAVDRISPAARMVRHDVEDTQDN
ncbi:hypothetical protein [Sphingomonas oryzagri]|jgi:hypothetical protein|uniref:Chitin-binding type-3 domain-containing protein n=1 Tax=Sphingomonas oryzagri TaxID=3042314 RepID=A0ABT6MWB4_9SPHN|nr:hypothetical protein [Sphingomonas oryzagri]MDH7637265.1 hypothetical protein [Sphingomonas oryzagri]